MWGVWVWGCVGGCVGGGCEGCGGGECGVWGVGIFDLGFPSPNQSDSNEQLMRKTSLL